MFDGKAFGEEVVGFVRDYLDREITALKSENEDMKARLKVLEDRPAPEVLKGDPGRDGKDGSDGRGIRELLIDREGSLIATMDDGSTKNLGPIVGKDGEPGKDGRDGFQLEDFACEVLDDDRTIQFSFRSAEHEHVATLKWPTVIDRGVWSDKGSYARGDGTTWAGSYWIAQRDGPGKPDTADGGWRLAVKRGRDGKDAK